METKPMYIYGHLRDDMELNIDGIKQLWIIDANLGYYENK